jgi:hypothetical protein
MSDIHEIDQIESDTINSAEIINANTYRLTQVIRELESQLHELQKQNEWIENNCTIVFYPAGSHEYPVEHNRKAHKDNLRVIKHCASGGTLSDFNPTE